jgi:hypothetical protein
MSRTSNINFVIFSPFENYVEYIGGATVPHTLAHLISLTGENVYLYANSTHPTYTGVTCIPYGTDVAFDANNTVVIFIAGGGEHTWEHKVPDCLKNAPNVVRWLVLDQNKLYNPDDKFYVFHKYWDVLQGQRVDGQLSVIQHDHNILRDRGLKREGTCYLIKGNLDTEADRVVHSSNDFCIDSVLYQVQGNKVEFLADLFNKKELFISYTPFSHASVLAAMCGCKSVVIPKKHYGKIPFDKEKWYSDIWCTRYGIACGLEDLPQKSTEMDKVIPHILEYEEVTQKNQVQSFIEDCYSWLEEKYDIKLG